MVEKHYEYQLKAGRTLAWALLTGAAALGFGWMALTNDRGLILYVVPLTKNGATIFYGVFAGLSALFSASAFVNVAGRGSLRQRIAFTKDGFVVPKSAWSAEEMVIPYASVLDLKEFTEPKNVVVIRHQGGEFTLEMDLLPSERAYAEIVNTLGFLVRDAKAKAARLPPADARAEPA